jgi:hypothetical protein
MHHLLVAGLVGTFLFSIIPGQAGVSEKEPVNVQPSVNTTPPWEITVEGPSWLSRLTGNIGSRGVTTHVDISATDILRRTNFIAALGGEVRRGRFGAYGGLLYLDAQTSAAHFSEINRHTRRLGLECVLSVVLSYPSNQAHSEPAGGSCGQLRIAPSRA